MEQKHSYYFYIFHSFLPGKNCFNYLLLVSKTPFTQPFPLRTVPTSPSLFFSRNCIVKFLKIFCCLDFPHYRKSCKNCSCFRFPSCQLHQPYSQSRIMFPSQYNFLLQELHISTTLYMLCISALFLILLLMEVSHSSMYTTHKSQLSPQSSGLLWFSVSEDLSGTSIRHSAVSFFHHALNPAYSLLSLAQPQGHPWTCTKCN